MRLNEIRIANLRNIREAVVHPGPKINIIFGDNGSGKSSFLESIHLLSRANSFRTNHVSEIINLRARQLVVSGTIELDNRLIKKITVGLKDKKRGIRIDGVEGFSRSDLLKCFPLQFVSLISYLLIEGPPTTRRQFLDWGVFHMEPAYSEEWKRFRRCLLQRNTLLKAGRLAGSGVWDIEFEKYGTIVAARRKSYLEQLVPIIQELGERILPSKSIIIEYFPGWDLDQGLNKSLIRDFKRDFKFGFTHSGPQKSDLVLKVDGRNCKGHLSRGQIKLLVLTIKLAQIKLLIDKGKAFGTLLIDDFCAELDNRNLKMLKQFLSDMDFQCFITAMDRNNLGTLCGIDPTLFHVEQGCIKIS
ncbi:MAG: DNA replication/repair protein RecF [Methylococcales bacterium]